MYAALQHRSHPAPAARNARPHTSCCAVACCCQPCSSVVLTVVGELRRRRQPAITQAAAVCPVIEQRLRSDYSIQPPLPRSRTDRQLRQPRQLAHCHTTQGQPPAHCDTAAACTTLCEQGSQTAAGRAPSQGLCRQQQSRFRVGAVAHSLCHVREPTEEAHRYRPHTVHTPIVVGKAASSTNVKRGSERGTCTTKPAAVLLWLVID